VTEVSAARRIVLLGSTGSIGTQAIDVIRRNPDRFRVSALSAGGRNPAALVAQAVELGVSHIGVADPGAVAAVESALGAAWPKATAMPQVVSGAEANAELAKLDCDIVLNAVDGSQGLRATLAALDAGRTVALANKESLIAGGSLVTSRAAEGQIVPVDSEHSALAQCLRAGRRDEVQRLILTASGGPFRGRTRAELADVTPRQAMAHPTWDMGPLITTNSATLVNKGLELIEAHLLFAIPYDRIAVVVHPQSIVHSMVEFSDGATIAQASPPDMRLPIALALAWPDRVPEAAPALDLTVSQAWQFEPLDDHAFPAVSLARRAGRAGALAPAVFNAANEALVEQFHAGRISFLQIVDTIADVLDEWLASLRPNAGPPGTVEEVEAADSWARQRARELVGAPVLAGG
jgi:1-deoxy-D-xylulose-5-phosphate reductoisomerase